MEILLTWLQYIGVGLAVGGLSGLLGVGGGIIMVPLMVWLWKLDMKIAIGTSLATMILTSVAGSWKHFTLGNVDVKLAACLAVGSMAGTVLIGAPLANHLPAETLKKIFGIFMVVSGLQWLGAGAWIGKMVMRIFG